MRGRVLVSRWQWERRWGFETKLLMRGLRRPTAALVSFMGRPRFDCKCWKKRGSRRRNVVRPDVRSKLLTSAFGVGLLGAQLTPLTPTYQAASRHLASHIRASASLGALGS